MPCIRRRFIAGFESPRSLLARSRRSAGPAWRLAAAAAALWSAASGWAGAASGTQGPDDPAARLLTQVVTSTPATAAPAAEVPAPSALDGQLFYQLLIGEIQLRQGQPIVAYEVVLDAARRTSSDQLFRRASDIALQARSGDRALAAARAWRTARPEATEPMRLQLQLLSALNRIDESAEPLQALLRLSPAADRAGLIQSLPRFFQRAPDAAQVARMLQTVLAPYTAQPATQAAALTTLGRAWLRAEDSAQAAQWIRRAHDADPGAAGPALAALDLMGTLPQIESVVRAHLATPAATPAVRMAYARTLTQAQRVSEAIEQVQTVTRQQANLPAPWLMLGALHVEMRQAAAAEQALRRFLQLQRVDSAVETAPDTRAAPSPTPVGGGGLPATATSDAAAADDDEDDSTAAGVSQAWLLMAQAAEIRQDFAAAEAYLNRIDNPDRLLEVQSRRASLLARQGRLDQGRALIRQVPAQGEDGERARLMAEVRLLREAKRWAEAFELLGQATARWPKDVDLLYEQSMMAEKLDRIDEMERLLRQVIAIQPNHGHAHNALGYSLADRNLRLPEARELIVRALTLSPGDPFITDSLGWVEFRMGRIDEALRLLREAYTKRPDVEIAAHLGEVLWVAGQAEEARRIWREGLAREPDNEVLRGTLQRLRPGL